MKGKNNEFDLFLNECQTYVWEWYIPEQKVRFGIPSLNSPWSEDKVLNVKLDTMLERVHPDDIQKVLVRHTSPLYKSDKMFEVDLRINVADELRPEGQASSGRYEWYGFRGKTIMRDRHGRPTYVRGIAINVDQRYRAQAKLLQQKDRQLTDARQKANYCTGVIQEVGVFISTLAENANTIISMDGNNDSETRMMCLSDLKDQVGHILELTDKFKFSLSGNELNGSHDAKTIPLWEHLAELQQVYSLKAGSQLRFYFSNLYDDFLFHVDVKVFDALLDNVIGALLKSHKTGYTTLSYVVDKEQDVLRITVSYTGGGTIANETRTAFTESGLGLSVCRLIAKRLWGNIQVEQSDASKLRYIISLPLNAHRMEKKEEDLLDELSRERVAEVEASTQSRAALPHVLIGMRRDDSLYRNQHLFDVFITTTTEELKAAFERQDPEIVFIDSSLPGKLSVLDLIAFMHRQAPDTPIIVTDDYAQRPLHKQVKALGARYLISNPLSLRKVNMMIKKYLK